MVLVYATPCVTQSEDRSNPNTEGRGATHHSRRRTITKQSAREEEGTLGARWYNTLCKSKTHAPLNREQTEEWKGWMQVLFLLYHYFKASELYNAIRLFIAAYVWMTGFGGGPVQAVNPVGPIGLDMLAVRLVQLVSRLGTIAPVCPSLL
jgi:hypothetical protein